MKCHVFWTDSTPGALSSALHLAAGNGQSNGQHMIRVNISLPSKVHYLSLDIEGGEMGVLRSLPWKNVDIWLLSVEVSLLINMKHRMKLPSPEEVWGLCIHLNKTMSEI